MLTSKKRIKVSIVYAYFNTPTEILESLKSLKQSVGNFSYEVIVVDNNSWLKLSKQVIKTYITRIIINTENQGYGKALNQGSISSKGQYLLLTNTDTIFLKNSIKFMIEKIDSSSGIGIIGPQFLSPDYRIQITGNGLPSVLNSIFSFTILNKIFPKNPFSNKYFLPGFDRKKEAEIPVICGACMLTRRLQFLKMKGFDERFFMYFEESDLCYRIKKSGYKVVYYPKSRVIHLGGKSSSNRLWIRSTFQNSRYKFFKKYNNIIQAILAEFIIRLLNKL